VSGRASRDKGKRAEQAVAKWLRANGWPAATTRATSGAQQGDDLVTTTGLSWEVKDHAKMQLAAWLDQAQEQAGGRPAVVIHKRRGVASPGGWYVTLSGADLLRLLGDPSDKP
jgi:predicted alpha/beta hydrolase